jgi:hypothetical protein
MGRRGLTLTPTMTIVARWMPACAGMTEKARLYLMIESAH